MNSKQNLQRDTLRKIIASPKSTDVQRELAGLRLAYSEDSKLLTGTVNKLIGVNRLYLHHLPTQTSGRWSTWITNWPRACVNQYCPREEHEWTDQCWSVRDILLPDSDEILITWDHDNIEGKIHDVVVDDDKAILAHKEGYDLHTLTCCDIFNMEYPCDKRNPHTSEADNDWRHKWDEPPNSGWAGKDTKQRVLAKNFNHGSKYTESYRFVHRIKGIERYGVSYSNLESLAKRYIASKKDAWQRKLDIMKRIRKDRIARSLYGFRRVFFDSSPETGREGFSHMISGTVSDYNNETLKLIEDRYGDYVRLLHNAHDGDKLAFKRVVLTDFYGRDKEQQITEFKSHLSTLIERPIEYEGRSLIMTAGIKIYA